MSSRPWFKFYASDWLGDKKLCLCTPLSRGLWVGLMAMMHEEGTPYGHLQIGPTIPTTEEIALLLSMRPEDVEVGLADLERRGVFERTDAGVIYSRRMVRDEERRTAGKEFGKKGGNPALRGADKAPHKTPPDSDSDSKSNKKRGVPDSEIKEVWDRHLEARAKFFVRKNGRKPPLPDLTPDLRRKIRRAIELHGLQKAKAAGVGIFYSQFHNGEENGKEFLSPHLCWRIQSGDARDVNNVERFAELTLEKESLYGVPAN